MKKLLSIALLMGSAANLMADSTEHHLQQLNRDLTPKAIGKYVPKQNTTSVIRLAMEEDLDADYENNYLLSDEMLSLLNKDGVLGSSFAAKIEKFQNYIDGLDSEEEKMIAIAEWKTLWLDKISERQVYLKGLKKLFTFDLTQSVNYDSNLRLESSDDAFSGADDTGGSLAGGINYRPFINKKKSKDWSYNMRLSGRRTYQAEENDLQYDFITFSNALTFRNIHHNIPLMKFSITETVGFQRGSTDSERRYEYNQGVINGKVQFSPFQPKSFLDYFQSGIQEVNLRFRSKHEEAGPGGANPKEDDLYAFSASYGHMYLRHKKGQPLQTFKWDIKAETQILDTDDSRDYNYLKLSALYTRELSDLTDKFDLTWINSGSLRLKDWSDPSAGGRDDEEEYFLSTGVRSVWTNYFSSSLNASYRKRNQGLSGAAGRDIDQWRVVLSNTFLTL